MAPVENVLLPHQSASSQPPSQQQQRQQQLIAAAAAGGASDSGPIKQADAVATICDAAAAAVAAAKAEPSAVSARPAAIAAPPAGAEADALLQQAPTQPTTPPPPTLPPPLPGWAPPKGLIVVTDPAFLLQLCAWLDARGSFGFGVHLADSSNGGRSLALTAQLLPPLKLPSNGAGNSGSGAVQQHRSGDAAPSAAAAVLEGWDPEAGLVLPALEGIALSADDESVYYVPLSSSSNGSSGGGSSRRMLQTSHVQTVPQDGPPHAPSLPPPHGAAPTTATAAASDGALSPLLEPLRALLAGSGGASAMKVTYALKQQLASCWDVGLSVSESRCVDVRIAAFLIKPDSGHVTEGKGIDTRQLEKLVEAGSSHKALLEATRLMQASSALPQQGFAAAASGGSGSGSGVGAGGGGSNSALPPGMQLPQFPAPRSGSGASGAAPPPLLPAAAPPQPPLSLRQLDACRRAALARKLYEAQAQQLELEGQLQPLLNTEMPLVKVSGCATLAGVR